MCVCVCVCLYVCVSTLKSLDSSDPPTVSRKRRPGEIPSARFLLPHVLVFPHIVFADLNGNLYSLTWIDSSDIQGEL